MNGTFVVVVIGVFLIALLYKEKEAKGGIPDMPSCARLNDYCQEYGNKNDIKYVIREPTKEKSIELLLDHIQTNACNSNRVYWRLAAIGAIIVSVMFWLYNYIANVNLSYSTYIFIFVLVTFANYWMRGYIAYHYDWHYCKRAMENIGIIKQKINNKSN